MNKHVLGIDLGSRNVKIVRMCGNELTEVKVFSTAHFYKQYCHYNGRMVVDFDKLGYSGFKFDVCVSTGYGRNNLDLESFIPINEVKAHVYGAIHQTQLKDFTLLDIGGQDVKVAQVIKGMTHDLQLNDKCAASCGRYLENMANVLDVSLQEVSLHYKDPVPLSATCAVFAESELIGQIAAGASVETLCAGVNESLYKRIKPMLLAYKRDVLVVSGGVAQNAAIIHFLKEEYNQVVVLLNPELNGAIGCCKYGGLYV